MICRIGLLRAGLLSAVLIPVCAIHLSTVAIADELPAIKASSANRVPACVTPPRLMAYLRSRNPKLDPRYASIAAEYKRHGDALGIRWDYAFFQMLMETDSLKYTGDVKAKQNNFAGLGATGGGVRGESFPDISSGVRAHLEHLLLYSGAHVDNPVAERTRNIQDWGVLTSWQKTLTGPITYTDMSKKWAPTYKNYSRDVGAIADRFAEGPCRETEPQDEIASVAPDAPPAKAPPAAKAKVAETGTTTAPAAGDRATTTAKAAEPAKTAKAPAATGPTGAPPAVSIINAPKEDAAPPAPEAPQNKATAPSSNVKVAAATTVPPKVSRCRVFTASYGGQKSVIIKAIVDDFTNYTVLDVNEGAEKREAEAYISAYAKGGEQLGEFPNQEAALDKAFELCPER